MEELIRILQKQDHKLDEIKKMMIDQKTVMTVGDLESYSGMARSYIYKLTSTGKIPFSKPLGKTIFFNKEEIDSWLLQNPVKTAEVIETEASNYVTLNQKGGQR